MTLESATKLEADDINNKNLVPVKSVKGVRTGTKLVVYTAVPTTLRTLVTKPLNDEVVNPVPPMKKLKVKEDVLVSVTLVVTASATPLMYNDTTVLARTTARWTQALYVINEDDGLVHTVLDTDTQ